MKVDIEEAVAYLAGLCAIMNIKNKKTEQDGEYVSYDEKLLPACLETVLIDVKLNQYKTKEHE